jgi:hypothetical protein
VNLRCYLSSLLRIHHPDCEVCSAREKYGVEMRKRLEELNWRTEPHSLKDGDHGEVGSKPGEVIRMPVSLAQRRKAGYGLGLRGGASKQEHTTGQRG